MTHKRNTVVEKGCPLHLQVNTDLILITSNEIPRRKNDTDPMSNLLLHVRFGDEKQCNACIVRSNTKDYFVWRVVAKVDIPKGSEIVIQRKKITEPSEPTESEL